MCFFFSCIMLTAMVFSLILPTGSTIPVNDISPVMARFCETGLPVARDTRAVTMVQPALGPSFGVAPWNKTHNYECVVLHAAVNRSGVWFPLLVMCKSVGQTSHSILHLPTQQWWVPGGMKIGELWMALAVENALNSPQRRCDRIRESSNTRGVNCEVCWTHGLSDYKHTHLHLFTFQHWV